jgi:hypothetical protein
MQNLKARLILVSAISFCIAHPAHAQDSAFGNLAADFAMADMMEANLKAQMGVDSEEEVQPSKTQKQQKTQRVAPAPANTGPLIYRPSLMLRESNVDRLITNYSRTEPDAAGVVRELTADLDLIAVIGDSIKPSGARFDNVADAYAVWWITAWNAAAGRNPELPSAQTVQAVSKQAGAALLAIPGYSKLKDAEKQNMAEALLFQMFMISSIAPLAEKYPSKHPRFRKNLIAEGLAMGLDFKRLELTSTGFVSTQIDK